MVKNSIDPTGLEALELRQCKNGLASVKTMFVLNCRPFPSPTRQGKKGGNFKTSMRFTEMNPLLYFHSSSKENKTKMNQKVLLA